MFDRVYTIALACLHWIPFTLRGVTLISVGWFALRYVALQQHDRLLLATCLGGLAIIVLMAMMVLTVGLWLRLRESADSSRVEAIETRDCRTGWVIPWLAHVPCLLVEIRWLNCPGVAVTLVRENGCLLESVRPSQRLQRTEIVRQFEIGDVFGLCRVLFSKTFPKEVRVEPFPAAHHSISQVRRDQQGDDLVHPSGKPNGDLIEMRHYRPGDPLKLVLWKHYARTGQLLVRQPENSVACLSQTIACFVAGPGDQATAGVARAIVTELTASGEEILFQADGSATATNSAPEAISQIIRSADLVNQGGRIIAGMGETIQSNAIRHCIAFVPSQPGAWIEQVLAGKAGSQLTIDAIMGIDEPVPPRRHRFLPTWMFRRNDGETIQLDQIRDVVRQLGSAGIATKIIHRRTGQTLSEVALEGLSG